MINNYLSKMYKKNKNSFIKASIFIIVCCMGIATIVFYNFYQESHYKQVFAQVQNLTTDGKFDEVQNELDKLKKYSSKHESEIKSMSEKVQKMKDVDREYKLGVDAFNKNDYETTINRLKLVEKGFINDKKYKDAQEKLKVSISKYVEAIKSKVNESINKGNYQVASGILTSANKVVDNQELKNMYAQIEAKTKEEKGKTYVQEVTNYFEFLQRNFEDVNQCIQRMEKLNENRKPNNEQWREALHQPSEQVDDDALTCDKYTPPEGFEEFHKRYTKEFANLMLAVGDLETGIADSDNQYLLNGSNEATQSAKNMQSLIHEGINQVKSSIKNN